MFALDTNTLIHLFKGKGRVGEHFRATPPNQIMIPAIVAYELGAGVRKTPSRRADLDTLVRYARILPFDAEAASAAAEIRGQLEAQGAMIGPLDVLIAGTALRYSATLVTHNLREFSRVAGLRLVDWF